MWKQALVFDPETKVGVVLLRNYNRGLTNLGRSTAALLDALMREGMGRRE